YLGEFRCHRLRWVQRRVRMAELEGNGALGEGPIGPPDRLHRNPDAETGRRRKEILARDMRGHGRSPVGVRSLKGYGILAHLRNHRLDGMRTLKKNAKIAADGVTRHHENVVRATQMH